MPIFASPGVYFETIDYSVYAPRLSKTILALVGKASKGPTEPTFVSTARQFTDLFGTPRRGDYSSLAALSFLEFGSSLWFQRIVGSAATKASVEIPRAYEISNELLATADNTGKYIFTGTLASSPVPGTVEITISDPNDATNNIVIHDDLNGDFSAYLNSGISAYPNFIDYDTGEYRFTLSSVSPSDVIELRYNYSETDVTAENTLTVAVVDSDGEYTGILAHPNIVTAVETPATFTLSVEVGTDTYTFTPSAPITDGFTLTGKNEADVTVGTGTLNTATGVWTVDLDTNPGSYNVEQGDIFVAAYTYSTFKIKNLGTVGASNPDGEAGDVYGASYIGTLGTVVNPNTVTVLVDGTSTCTDDGDGNIITGVLTCTNDINYTTKAVSFALVSAPTTGFEVRASYMAKYTHVIDTIGVGGSESGSVSATVTMAPIVKGSVTVFVKTTELVDDGDGNLIGDNGNGTIDYNTGIINVNYVQTLVEGDTITATYLSKLGEVSSLYEGSYYNNMTVEFYKDPFYGYGLKVWNPSQLTTQTPEENWKSITFVDNSTTSYFLNKITSTLVEITLFDEDVTATPVLNTKLVLTGGDEDEANINNYSAISALASFQNAETYDINLVACPDFPGDRAVANELISLCEVSRGDCFALIDPPIGLTPQQVVNWHNGDGQWANEVAFNSSFAALYYPWLQISDTFTESLQWVPPSVRVASVYAYNDSVSEVWNAPAGLNRGRLFKVQKLERSLAAGDRDLLYATNSNAVNPLCDFVSNGPVVYGQKTLQRTPTALDRVNVRRLLIYVTKLLATATQYLVFQPNDMITWSQYVNMVQPYLDSIKSRRGLYDFRVVCDSSTNSNYDIDTNTMYAEVWLQPTRTAERIINRFLITSTGAVMEEVE